MNAFIAAQDEVIRHWSAQFTACGRGALGRDDMLHASTTALVSCARNWETFRSDWHVRAVATDASVLKEYLLKTIMSQLQSDGDRGKPVGKLLGDGGIKLELHMSRYPTIAVVEALLDSRDRNMTFTSKKDACTKSDAHLIPKWAEKVKGLRRDDWAVVELVRTARNAVAHGSKSSMVELNRAMREMEHTSVRRLRTFKRSNAIRESGIGAYLYAQSETPGNYPNVRVVALCLWLQDVARKLQ